MAEYTSPLTSYESEIKAGSTYSFGIETMPMHDPDKYRDHVDQPVTVLKHLEDGVDYDGEGTRHLLRVRAEDGWEGEIWDYELEPATDGHDRPPSSKTGSARSSSPAPTAG